MAKKLLNYNLLEPLGGITAAKVDINSGDGNLEIGSFSSQEPILVRGALQYREDHNPPESSLDRDADQATLTVISGGGGQRWLRMPWSSCNGGTEWQIQLNPSVAYEITARTGGGIIKIDLSGMDVSQIQAETGGGIVELTLPEITSDIKVNAKTGAGKVLLVVPAGVAAKIYATTGMGKVIVEPHFIKVAEFTYQSPNYDEAEHKADITIGSGAGQVSVAIK